MKTQKEISEFLGISEAQFSYLLDGKRHLKLIPARELCEIIPSSPDIWQEGGGTSKQRRLAWLDYQKEELLTTKHEHIAPNDKRWDKRKHICICGFITGDRSKFDQHLPLEKGEDNADI